MFQKLKQTKKQNNKKKKIHDNLRNIEIQVIW